MKKVSYIILGFLFSMSSVSFAQIIRGNSGRTVGTQADLSFFKGFLMSAGSIIAMLPPILMGLAVVVFFWYLIQFIINKNKGSGGGKDENKKNASGMAYSLLAIFVMVTLWGIIAFFGDAIGINSNVQVTAPTLPGIR